MECETIQETEFLGNGRYRVFHIDKETGKKVTDYIYFMELVGF